MINYYCPGFVEAQPAYRHLFKLKELYPECFYNNVKISRIYGTFPNMIWNGGGYWFGQCLSRQKINRMIEWYANKDVVLQLNFTNPLLKEEDLYDRYCNMVLDVASQYDFVEILVCSPILEEYIRNKYPHLKIDKSIVSTTKNVMESENDNLEYYLKASEQYNKYVLPRKYTIDLSFLKEIPVEKRDKFEILVNDPCPLDCPFLYSHYERLAEAQLFEDVCEGHTACKMPFYDSPFRFQTYSKYQYTYEEICEVFEPMGFSEIKLSGRTDMITVILSIVPYLIKPEYRRDVYTILFDYYKTGEISVPDFRD